MINFNGCPRCNGSVISDYTDEFDSPYCVNCGWRQTRLAPEILAEVEAHMGKEYVERKQILPGRPTISDWERKVRRVTRLAS